MRNVFILFTLIFSSLILSGQPTYTASDYADPGDTYVVTKVYAPQLLFHLRSIQREGANKTWDFSNMRGGIQKRRKFYNPAGALDYTATYIAMCSSNCLADCLGQCAADGDSCRSTCSGFLTIPCTVACDGVQAACSTSCPATCSAQCTGNTLNWNLAEKRRPDIDFTPLIDFKMEDRYNIMGVGNPLPFSSSGTLTHWAMASRIRTTLVPSLPGVGLPIVIPYTDPDDKLRFPITYGDSHTDQSEFGFDLSSLSGALPIPTDFGFTVTQDRKTEVVGYGTIITPHGTYTNALKVRTELHKEYNVMIEGIQVNTADWPDLLDPINEVEYLWFDAAEGIPVFRVYGHVEFGLESYEGAEYLDNPGPINWLIFKDDGENVIGEEADEELFAASLATTIFPNPFNDGFNLEMVSPVDGTANIQIYNAMGQLVKTETHEVAAHSETVHNINLERGTNASGLYIIRVQVGNQFESVIRAVRQ